MRIATLVAVFVGGAVACYLLISVGLLDKVDGIPGTQEEPFISLPTYLSFLSVLLTAVTVVLAALAIGIGVVAAYTFREITDSARKAVSVKVEEALSDRAINRRIDEIISRQRNATTVGELEESFDSTDNGER